MRKSVVSGSTVALFVAGFSAATCAQNAAPASAPPDQLQEIIVTAQKHEESAQKTPISMSVFTASDLLQHGVKNLQSLTNIEPDVNFTTEGGSGYIAIRGIASTDVTETGDPAIAVSSDGFFMNRSYNLFASMYDIERVEVLKGPQGTLYGRNAAGGVINIITQHPTDQFGGYASVDAGNYRSLNYEGAINIPLNDAVQFRVSGESAYHGGYRDNPGFPSGDTADNRSVRAQVAFQPWSGFNGWLSVQSDDSSGFNVMYTGPMGTSGPGVTGPSVTPAVPYQLAGGFPIYAPFSLDLRETRYRWEFSQSGLPGGMTVTYLGGYDITRYHDALDTTEYPGSANTASQFSSNENPGTQNEELRLSGQPNDKLFWQVGGFYFREVNSPLYSYLEEEGGPFNGQDEIAFDYAVNTLSTAGFGQVQYSITDQVKVSGGLRYTEDQKERTGNAYLNCAVVGIPTFLCTGSPPAVVTPGNGDIDENKVTYHVGVDWSPTASTLLYAKYDTGYKAGGFNSNGSAPSVNYGPETVNSAEIGTKNRFWHDRFQANLSLFDMKYTGYQADQATNVISGDASGVFNAGDASVYGLESQFVTLITPETRLDLNATFLHARFTNGHALDASTNVSEPLDGNSLPNAPNVAAYVALEHTLRLPNDAGLTVRVDGKYQSRYDFSIFDQPDTSQQGYAMGDVAVTYAPNDGRWNLQAYVNNFANRSVLEYAERNPTANGDTYEFAPPRTYGLKLFVRFGGK